MVALNGLPRASALCSGRKWTGWSARRPRGERAAHTAGAAFSRKVFASVTGSTGSALILLLLPRHAPDLRHRRVERRESARSTLPELSLQAVQLGVDPLPLLPGGRA